MTIREAAERIGKHNDTIRRAIQSGKLESTKVKGVWDISDTAVSFYHPPAMVSLPHRFWWSDNLGIISGIKYPGRDFEGI